MKSTKKYKRRVAVAKRTLVSLSAVTVAACTAPDPTQNEGPQTATTRLNINSRGVTSQAAGAGSKSSSSYRAHVVIGPEVPVAQGTSANYRVLLGPIIPPTGDIEDQVQVFGQPEYASYRFEATSSSDWVLTLYVGSCSASSRAVVYQRSESGLMSVNGDWLGLSPGTTYCWIAEILGFSGPTTKMGEFTTPSGASVTRFNMSQAGTSAPFDVVGDAVLSAGPGSAPQVSWGTVANAGSDFACDDFEPALQFAAGQRAIIPGDILPASGFTIEAWVRAKDIDWSSVEFPLLTARSSSPDNTSGSGYDSPGLRFAWKNGRAEACLWTDQTSHCLSRVPSNITNRDWVQFSYRYSGAQHAVFINGIRLASSNRRGSIRGNHDICLGGCGNTQNNVFSSNAKFELGKVVIYDRALTTSQIAASYDSGQGRIREDYRTSDQIALWNFVEAPTVQNFYSTNGKWAGHLGGTRAAAADDPIRTPVYASTLPMYAGTAATLWGRDLKCQAGCVPGGPRSQVVPTELDVGPSYCARVTATIGSFQVASRPAKVTRRLDTQVPSVSANPLTVVAECDRTGEARVDVQNGANATDDWTANPVIAARLGSQTGSVITFPRNFPMGSSNVYYSATDDWNNVGWTAPAQTIRVRDRTAPSVTPGPALVVEAVSPSGTGYAPTLQATSDVCDNTLNVTYSPQGPYPLGDTVVTFTVTDDSLNAATANRTVRVVDTTPPTFSPALTTILLGHPGVACFEVTPPTPTAVDNGYDSSVLTVSGARVSGPGAPNCYDVGDHIYRWTASDPAGNSVSVDQTIRVVSGSIDVAFLGLQVPGVTNPTPGQFFKASVTLQFQLSGGAGQYNVAVTPTPVSLTNSGSTYSARYEGEGSYPQILVQVRDQNGTGANVGSAAFQGFGIDQTGPVAQLDIGSCPGCILPYLDQSGVDPNDSSTAPSLVKGEKLEFNRIRVSDGNYGQESLGNGLSLQTGGAVQCVSVPAPNLATLPSPACSDGRVPAGVVGTTSRDLYKGYSVEMWVRPEVLGHQTLFAVPNRPTDAGGSAMELFTTPDGRVCFGGYISDARNHNRCIRLSEGTGTVVESRTGVIQARRWHHIVATWDWAAGVARIYVDGVATAFRRDTDLFTAARGLKLCDATMGSGGVTAMIIGAHLNEDGQTASNQFAGDIGQVRLAMSVMTHEQILQNYRGGAGQPLTPSATDFALFNLDGDSTAQYGLQSVVDTANSVCDTGETCAWSNPVTAFLGATIGSDPGDPARVDVGHPADGASSGLTSVQISLVNRADNSETLLVQSSSVANGTPIATASRVMEGFSCSQNNAACTPGLTSVDVSRLATLSTGGYAGRFLLRVRATDAAGNSTTRDIAFNLLDYVGALDKGIASLDVLIPQFVLTELEDARLWFAVAKSYFELSRKYEDGSFLRAAGALQSLEDAEDNGAATGTISQYVARALYGEVKSHHDQLGSGSFLPGDQGIWEMADRSITDATFYGQLSQNNPQLQVSLSRKGYDDLAMLYPRFRNMRERMNSTRGVWQSGLQSFSAGNIDASNLRTSIGRLIQLQGAMAQTRDMLRETLYLQIEGILSNPYTSQRQTLDEMIDVLDKSNSTDIDEEGDLMAITDLAVQDACLDRLAFFTLDDRTFTQCYLRLNDLARFLDTVSEPLIHTYRMRTGLGLALFNMLETSLYLSPTGVPWVTSGQPYIGAGSDVLVLPDSVAANISGAVALSTVDLSDNTLANAYSQYEIAKARLESGDINGAWDLFVQERCLLLRIFNRYYSSDNANSTPADPKEAPIDPTTVGCQ